MCTSLMLSIWNLLLSKNSLWQTSWLKGSINGLCFYQSLHLFFIGLGERFSHYYGHIFKSGGNRQVFYTFVQISTAWTFDTAIF